MFPYAKFDYDSSVFTMNGLKACFRIPLGGIAQGKGLDIFLPMLIATFYLNNNSGILQALIRDAVVLPSNRLCIREWL